MGRVFVVRTIRGINTDSVLVFIATKTANAGIICKILTLIALLDRAFVTTTIIKIHRLNCATIRAPVRGSGPGFSFLFHSL